MAIVRRIAQKVGTERTSVVQGPIDVLALPPKPTKKPQRDHGRPARDESSQSPRTSRTDRARALAVLGAGIQVAATRKRSMVTFYDFPREHWKHLRTTNPVESSFAAH